MGQYVEIAAIHQTMTPKIQTEEEPLKNKASMLVTHLQSEAVIIYYPGS